MFFSIYISRSLSLYLSLSLSLSLPLSLSLISRTLKYFLINLFIWLGFVILSRSLKANHKHINDWIFITELHKINSTQCVPRPAEHIALRQVVAMTTAKLGLSFKERMLLRWHWTRYAPCCIRFQFIYHWNVIYLLQVNAFQLFVLTNHSLLLISKMRYSLLAKSK